MSTEAPAAHSPYRGVVLAPMVRCGTLPLRALALRYGAHAVWGEEIIAMKLAQCNRVENTHLGTIDFVTPDGGTVVLRVCDDLERGKMICQLGAATAEHALAAAKVVENDVAGIDINMGCPIKFSIQGGMGAALLEKPQVGILRFNTQTKARLPRLLPTTRLSSFQVAQDIVRTLVSSCRVPVSAKIRLLKTMPETVAFAKGLADAGAACVTLHMRSREERDGSDAHWESVAAIAEAIAPTPVLANGDMYNWDIIDGLIKDSGVAGVMVARPALLNTSMFRRAPLLPLEDVLYEYLEECVHWDIIYQNAKYTVRASSAPPSISICSPPSFKGPYLLSSLRDCTVDNGDDQQPAASKEVLPSESCRGWVFYAGRGEG